MRLGILGSTRGTVMMSIIDAIQQKRVTAEIAVVLSNKINALILEKAKAYHIPAFFVEGHQKSKEEYEDELTQILKDHAVDLIILIGYMGILSHHFTTQWMNRCINIHPSLLPQFAGAMDLNVHQAVLDAKLKQTGCTVHYVTDEVDAGPILLQKKCIVLPSDNVERLKARVQELEGSALIEVINTLSQS